MTELRGRPVRIGTRRSPLALWQTEWVAARLREHFPSAGIEITGVVSQGDLIQDRPLPAIGGKGLFTQELDAALLEGRIDLAVHSLKDLPTALPEGLTLAAIPAREDARDVFAGKGGARLNDLPPGSAIGSSSLRRRALLLHFRPDLVIEDIRGNVDTRLAKLDQSPTLRGIFLAAAGLRRLGRLTPEMEPLDPVAWPPAAGQGALGIVARADDGEILDRLTALEDPATRAAVTAERALLRGLGGGCQVPIGAHARLDGERLVMDSFVATPDGKTLLRDHGDAVRFDAEPLGAEAAQRLLSQGAAAILAGAGVSSPERGASGR